jgi:hypothetical protein
MRIGSKRRAIRGGKGYTQERGGTMTRQHDGVVDCKQADKIDRMDQEMSKLNQAMFFGNGQPSVLAQLAVLRQIIMTLSWLVGVTCAAVIGQIVARVVIR